MADFYQSDSIATLHRLQPDRLAVLEKELERFSAHTGMGLILPALISEFERPAMRRIAGRLRDARYFSNIVVAIGRATKSQVQGAATFFRGFKSKVTILWIEDPRVQEVFQTLERRGLAARPDGKGRTCWLSMGYLLGEGKSDVIALHDCDIVNYDREIPAALCYPLAHPNMDFDLCKGYYARISEKLHGRVTRLFLAPLLQSIREALPHAPFLNFLSEFRYPLAGEFAMKASLARRLQMPGDWGLEVGVLSEAYRHCGAARICQADIAENYEHKHQELSADDPSRGLRRMTLDISRALLRSLEKQGLTLLPGQIRRIAAAYQGHAECKIRQYEGDALMNGLRFDRQEEAAAVATFSRSLEEAIALRDAQAPEPAALPSWERVEREAPGILHSLTECDFETANPVRIAMPNWLQGTPQPAFSARVP